MMRCWAAAGLLVVTAASSLHAQTPEGTAFTYQGRLTDGGSPASGAYDLRFTLFDAATAGSPVGSASTLEDVAVNTGLFTVALDFGSVAFDGSARWLGVEARPGASTGAFIAVGPRQRLTPAPSAIHSASVPWTGITGKPAGFADDVDDDSGGDITAVNASTGLTGGALTGDATLSVNFGGTGAAATAARSDHNHTGTYSPTNHNHIGQSWTGATSPGLEIVGTGATGLRAESSSATTGSRGLYGVASSTGVLPTYGVVGEINSRTGAGLRGEAISSLGITAGVLGLSASTLGRGVWGQVTATTGPAHGVVGQTDSSAGRGVWGQNTATSGLAFGVYGETASTTGCGVCATGSATDGPNYGVYGETNSRNGHGVFGIATTTLTGDPIGVEGRTNSVTGIGVKGLATATAGFGIWGESATTTGFAGYFAGRVHVAGMLSKAAGTFKIDHPLDPENKYLYHSFVESPDMKNVYDGVATTDDLGYATVELPDWFEALNRDFRYQLTVVDTEDGDVFVQAKVVKTVADHRFTLRTSAPRVVVSWQVTGIRDDAFARAHRVKVEEDKPDVERGTYLHPVEWGQPAARGVDARPR
ncbi:MAG TPA: hypothetical protein VFQ51_04600 [Vicinamibacteria bacterium]|nr:hypothetical protein [Vicinamibacteria bacterium]